jgi:hypothetical protein
MIESSSTNIMEELSRQVERVTIIRERYRAVEAEHLENRAGNRRITLKVNCSPVIAMITGALEVAHRAAANGDALMIARIIQELKRFEE